MLPNDLQTALSLPDTATPAQALEKLRQLIGEKPKIAVGSYVGTNTYGQANTNSLTFDFVPKLIIFWVNGSILEIKLGDTNYKTAVLLLKDLTNTYQNTEYGVAQKSGNVYVVFSVTGSSFWYTFKGYTRIVGTTVEWYVELDNPPGDGYVVHGYVPQLNETKMYSYLAIG